MLRFSSGKPGTSVSLIFDNNDRVCRTRPKERTSNTDSGSNRSLSDSLKKERQCDRKRRIFFMQRNWDCCGREMNSLECVGSFFPFDRKAIRWQSRTPSLKAFARSKAVALSWVAGWRAGITRQLTSQSRHCRQSFSTLVVIVLRRGGFFNSSAESTQELMTCIKCQQWEGE